METIIFNNNDFFEYLGVYEFGNDVIRATFYGHITIFEGLVSLN